MNYLLKLNDSINNDWHIKFQIKKTQQWQLYQIANKDDQRLWLRLNLTNSNENIFLTTIKHPHIQDSKGGGIITINGQSFSYTLLPIIAGESLKQKVLREMALPIDKAELIILEVLDALQYLHALNHSILHNNITPNNIWLCMSTEPNKTLLTNFINATHCNHPIQPAIHQITNDSYHLFFFSNNILQGKEPCVKDEIFSSAALFYYMLMGYPPYSNFEYSEHPKLIVHDIIKLRKKDPFYDTHIPKNIQKILTKALSSEEEQYASIKDFIAAIKQKNTLQITTPNKKGIKRRKGFASISGMQALKDTIQIDIIDALNNKELYSQYKLSIPNGMLLYGPPGCGKTFFAEKMAEEVGFKFYQIKPSDIQSKYINESQENIKKLFEKAFQNAPSIIFIDELDAIVPRRDTHNLHHMQTSAVNEFLAQMNNCGEANVFIIGATNRPKAIDPAIMRPGRLDKHIYIPPPDFEARVGLFQYYLENRPITNNMSYVELASKTQNYVASDIKFLCDEAARQALKQHEPISLDLILEVISNKPPSLSEKDIIYYQQLLN